MTIGGWTSSVYTGTISNSISSWLTCPPFNGLLFGDFLIIGYCCFAGDWLVFFFMLLIVVLLSAYWDSSSSSYSSSSSFFIYGEDYLFIWFLGDGILADSSICNLGYCSSDTSYSTSLAPRPKWYTLYARKAVTPMRDRVIIAITVPSPEPTLVDQSS